MSSSPSLAPSSSGATDGKLLIFDTHPIQYRSPVFRDLFARHPEMKVCFFNPGFDAGRWWFREVGQIPKQSWELPLCEGFPNEFLRTADRSWSATFWRLGAKLREESPAAVLIYGYYLPEHWMLRWWCGYRRIPLLFVGETFSNDARGWRRRFREPLLRYFFRGVQHFVAIGEKNREHYRTRGVPEERITPAKYCTDTSFFSLPRQELGAVRRAWRERLGIPEDAFVALFVGRLVERKRPFDVLSLHERLAHPRLHTVMVGNGLLEDALQKTATRMSHVHFTGFQNQAQTREAYHGADVLVVPSEFETWGLVVNEAFACGLPALVTDTCGVAGDLVVPGKTGFVFPKGDLPAAADRLGSLLQTPDLRETLGEAARTKVATEYTVAQFSTALLAAYQAAARR